MKERSISMVERQCGGTKISETIFGAIKGWFVRRKFKRILKEAREEDIIAAHIVGGFTRWDSADGKVTELRKGKALLRITRGDAQTNMEARR